MNAITVTNDSVNNIKLGEKLNSKLELYLGEVELTSLDETVSEKEIEKLLYIFSREFLNYQLDFDEYSSLCEELLIVLQHKKQEMQSDIEFICAYGADLSWYIRNKPDRAAHFLEIILAYYYDHKYLLGVNNKLKELLHSYFDWAEANFGQENLSLEQGEKIGVCLVEDYSKQKISANELSKLCSLIYPRMDSSLEIFSLLKSVAEIEQISTENYQQTVKELLDYFEVEEK